MMFFSISIYTNSAENKLKDYINSVGPHLKLIGIFFYAIVLNEEKKKQKYTTHITIYEKAYGPTNKTSVTS